LKTELKTAKVNHTTGKHVDDQAVEDSYRNNPKYQKKLENQKRTEQRIKEQTEKYNAYLNSGDPEKIAEAQRWFTNDGNDAWRNVDISLGDTAKVIKESAKKLADSGFITKEQYHKIVKQSTEVIKNVPENNNVENYDINSEYQNWQVIIQNGISSTFHKDNSW